MVMHSLSSEFTLLRLVNGEAVAPQHLGVANGFVKPKLGELGELGGLAGTALHTHSAACKVFRSSSSL